MATRARLFSQLAKDVNASSNLTASALSTGRVYLYKADALN